MMKQSSSVVELLVHMVSFDTVNEVTSKVPFPERKMLESIEDLAQAWGFNTTHLPIASNPDDTSYNLLITYEASPDAPWLWQHSSILAKLVGCKYVRELAAPEFSLTHHEIGQELIAIAKHAELAFTRRHIDLGNEVEATDLWFGLSM